MRVKQICYHIERARHFEALAAAPARPGGRPGFPLPKKAAERAAGHWERAAALFADGLKRWRPLADNPNARYQRRHNARIHANGPGRGRRGQRWGRTVEIADARAAAAASEDST